MPVNAQPLQQYPARDDGKARCEHCGQLALSGYKQHRGEGHISNTARETWTRRWGAKQPVGARDACTDTAYRSRPWTSARGCAVLGSNDDDELGGGGMHKSLFHVWSFWSAVVSVRLFLKAIDATDFPPWCLLIEPQVLPCLYV